MKLESQVCSLELAQKLKALGVKQESIFAWCQNHEPFDEYYIADQLWRDDHDGLRDKVSAFTVAELGELLEKGQGENMLGCRHLYARLCMDESILKDTEADARARAAIYLLENKLITV